MEENCKRWIHYAVPRKNRPKLTHADQERFMKRKRQVDERNAILIAEAEENRKIERGK